MHPQRKGGRGDFDFPPDSPNRPKGGRSRPLETHLREGNKCCSQHALTASLSEGVWGALEKSCRLFNPERGKNTLRHDPAKRSWRKRRSAGATAARASDRDAKCGRRDDDRGRSCSLGNHCGSTIFVVMKRAVGVRRALEKSCGLCNPERGETVPLAMALRKRSLT